MTLEEKLKEIAARHETEVPRALSQSLRWHKVYDDREKLLAALRLCREQRDELAHNNVHARLDIIDEYLEKEDAALLAILEGK